MDVDKICLAFILRQAMDYLIIYRAFISYFGTGLLDIAGDTGTGTGTGTGIGALVGEVLVGDMIFGAGSTLFPGLGTTLG